MKKIIYTFILVCIVNFTFISCTKEIFIEIPDNDPKLVVYAYLSPDKEFVEVSVSRSVPLYHVRDYDHDLVIKDAVVELKSENSDWVRISFVQDDNVYKISQNIFPIVESKKYYLRVSASDFKSVKSEVVIPQNLNLNFRFFKVEKAEDNNSSKYYFKFNDIGGVHNYYGFKAWVNAKYMDEGGMSYYRQELYMDNFSWVISDKVFDGREKMIVFSSYYYDEGLVADTVFVKVLQTDKNFYHFHYSLDSYYGSEGNPFAEPTPIFSNIENGLGCFAGFSERVYAFPLAR
jgi:hypothetical protein